MSQFLLSQNTPEATPLVFEFEGKEWNLFPVDTQAIAAQLEPWVVQRVRRNVEQLRPDDGCDDPLLWRIYQEDREAARKSIERGLYGALTNGYQEVLANSEDGFREQVYWCVRFRDSEWTREHVKRLLADKARYDEFNAAWIEFNYPKAMPTGDGSKSSANNSKNDPSTGATSCETLLSSTPSIPAV